MYHCYSDDRQLIPDGHLIEVKYEDLITDPIVNIRQIYRELELGQFDDYEEKMRERSEEGRSLRPSNSKYDEGVKQCLEPVFSLYRELFDYPGSPQ